MPLIWLGEWGREIRGIENYLGIIRHFYTCGVYLVVMKNMTYL